MKRKPCRTAHRKNETNLLFGGVPARSFSAFGAILLAVAFLLPALCAGCASPEVRREITYEPMFDPVCSFYAGTETKEEFDGLSDKVRALLKELNGLFDVYGEGAQNGLKAVNDAAGKAPVKVDHKVLELMRFSLSYAERTGGAFDPVLGAVTLLWKEAQEKGAPPDGQALAEAGTHVGAPLLQIDEKNGTLISSARYRILRGGENVWEGKLQSLKHFKDEVKEVTGQQECGVHFAGFEKFAEGDTIECYILEELPRSL